MSVGTGPPGIPAGPGADHVERVTFRAMATDVTLAVVDPGPECADRCELARRVFARIEESCSRFRPDSPLMKANRAGIDWCTVPAECFQAIAEAALAHLETDGLFDPRVLEDLLAIGYDRTLPFGSGVVARPEAGLRARGVRDRWMPDLDERAHAVRIGTAPIDLGGIGKGLAVRGAAAELAGAGLAFAVEAGGDCYLGGPGPDGDGWHVGVEDPGGGQDPIAVLHLSDVGCATSSTRVRTWLAGKEPVHHLIDPRSGRSARTGLTAVTVVHADPATAEVWSKALFVAGAEHVAPLCDRHGLAALWVSSRGEVEISPAMAGLITWLARRA